MNIHNKKRLGNICVPLKDEFFVERLRRRNRAKYSVIQPGYGTGWRRKSSVRRLAHAANFLHCALRKWRRFGKFTSQYIGFTAAFHKQFAQVRV